MCSEALSKSAIQHMQVLVYKTQVQGRQAHDRRALQLLLLNTFMWLRPQSVCEK